MLTSWPEYVSGGACGAIRQKGELRPPMSFSARAGDA